MRSLRKTLTIGTRLLIAFPIALHYSAAQSTGPNLTTLHSFSGSGDGASPFASLVIGNGGVLYGTTQTGGTAGMGTVYSVKPPASPGGSWTETVLHTFTGGSDGASPYAGVVVGSHQILYGTTFYGGSSNLGTVYSLTPPASPGGVWTETVLYNFAGGVADGANAEAPIVLDSGGVLYGTSDFGGASNAGTVYSLTPLPPPEAPGPK
jgi:uncharacterized repeat protein (TIGR03803 family)